MNMKENVQTKNEIQGSKQEIKVLTHPDLKRKQERKKSCYCEKGKPFHQSTTLFFLMSSLMRQT